MIDGLHIARIEKVADTIASYGAEADARAMIILQAAAWHLYRSHGALFTADSLFRLGEVFADSVPAQPRLGKTP